MNSTVLADAAAALAEASASLLDPWPKGCLHCNVQRMVTDYGCDDQMRFVRHFQNVRPARHGPERRLCGQGACDCQSGKRGDLPWSSAIRERAVTIEGTPTLRRSLPDLIGHGRHPLTPRLNLAAELLSAATPVGGPGRSLPSGY